MAILSDRWIRETAQNHAMIEPFVEAQRRDGCISYGLSSYGYDARVADEFKIFTNVDSAIVDPKDFAANSFVDRKLDVCVIPPNSFALCETVEVFDIPGSGSIPVKVAVAQIVTMEEGGEVTLSDWREQIRSRLSEAGGARRVLDALRKTTYVSVRPEAISITPLPAAPTGS